MPQYEFKQWSESEFFANQESWQNLLANSQADPLFLSWAWASQWWQLRRPKNAELCIIAAYAQNQLVLLAPFYTEPTSYVRGYLKFKRLQLIGSRWDGHQGIRQEYCGLIVHSGHEKVIPKLAAHLQQSVDWDEATLADWAAETPPNQQFIECLKAKLNYHRADKIGETYRVDTTGGFKEYLASLGKNSRLKLYNRRTLLSQKGEVTLKWLQQEDLLEYLTLLNGWQKGRWGFETFCSTNKAFMQRIIGLEGIELKHSSALLVDNQVVSVMINLTVNRSVYNIQLSYQEDFHKKIALGSLHIGYTIEKCMADPEIDRIDFLEGSGKHTNYKARIAKPYLKLKSQRLFKSKKLALVFWLYDRFLRKGTID